MDSKENENSVVTETVPKENQNTVLITVSENKVCISSDSILQIQRNLDIFPLPFMSEYIAGVTNYGGTIYAVIDLDQLLLKKKCTSSQFVIISDENEICLHVDEALSFVTEYTETNNSVSNKYFSKEISVNGENAFMLNLKAIISKVKEDIAQKD